VKLLDYSITWIAASGHWTSHALHTRHSWGLVATDFLSLISKTPTGQVSEHVPHPVHLALSTTIFTILSSSKARISVKAKM
jgi:hypothetical protein